MNPPFTPLRNIRRLERDIVVILLERLAEAEHQADYPPELLLPRRAGFITQVVIARLQKQPTPAATGDGGQ